MIPKDYYYCNRHLWVKRTKETVRIGITDYGQMSLGEVLAIELPLVDSCVNQGESLGSIDCMKTTSTIFSPVSGRVVAVNTRLEDSPDLINSDPYEDGWIAEIRLSDVSELDQLMTAKEYEDIVES